MAWARQGTFSANGTSDKKLSVTQSVSNKFLVDLCHCLGESFNSSNLQVNYDSNSGNNFALRYNANGGSDATNINHPKDQIPPQQGSTWFVVRLGCNISGQEKLFITWLNDQGGSGAGNAPKRLELVSKYTVTSGQITTIEYMQNGTTENMTLDSNLMVIGSDGTPSVATWQNGLEFHETDTNKDYVWNSSTSAWIQIT